MLIASLHLQVQPYTSRRRGFTLAEMLVSIGVLTILIGLVMALTHLLRGGASQVRCLYNLTQIRTALVTYVQDYRIYPDPDSLKTSPTMTWEGVLANAGLIGRDPDIFRCPADNIMYPTVNSSYDWRDTGNAATTLAGHPFGDTQRENFALAYDVGIGFHAKGKVNVVKLDGSALAMDQSTYFNDMVLPVRDGAGTGGTGTTGSGTVLSGQ
jgi:prepilin-type N-terminal cleavage/methylation domain-containing protein